MSDTSGIIAGFRYVRHTPALVSALVRCLCVVLPGACLSALLPSYARTELHVSGTGFGLLLGAAGVGALVAAGVLERLRSKLSADNLLSLAACASATALGSLSLVRSSLGAAGAMVLSGAAWMVMLSTLNIAVQTAAAPWVRTRVLAIYLVVFQAALAAGSIVWGEVAARAGARIALLAGAVALVGLLAARVRFGIESTQADFTPSLRRTSARCCSQCLGRNVGTGFGRRTQCEASRARSAGVETDARRAAAPGRRRRWRRWRFFHP